MAVQQAAEQYLRTSGLRYTIVRPGGLSDGPADDVGRLIVAHEDTLLGRDDDPGRVISRDTVRLIEARCTARQDMCKTLTDRLCEALTSSKTQTDRLARPVPTRAPPYQSLL